MSNSNNESINYQMRIPASLSIFGSSFIIASYLFFPNIRKFKYLELVFFVSINDLLASIGVVLGNVSSGSIACWIQGMVTNYNFLVSIAYTTFISYELYLVILYQTKIESYTMIHVFCWIFPLITTLLPLTTNNYGKEDDDDTSWCFLSNRSNSPTWGDPVWTLLSFYVWIWLAIICVSYMYVMIWLKLRKSAALQEPSNQQFPLIISTLSMYPFLLIICWSCASVVGVYVSFASSRKAALNSWTSSFLVDVFGTILPALQGFLHSIIFLSRSKVVRNEWTELIRLYCNCCHKSTNNSDVGVISPFQFMDSSLYGTDTDSRFSQYGQTMSSLSITGSSRYSARNSVAFITPSTSSAPTIRDSSSEEFS